MKKIMAVMIMALVLPLSLATKGFAEEAVPPKKIVSQIASETAGEPVPPEILTKSDIKKIVRSEGKTVIKEIKKQNEEIRKQNEEFLQKKDSKTATAIQEQNDKISGKIDEFSFNTGKTLKRFESFGRTAIIALIALIGVVLITVIALMFRKKAEPATKIEATETIMEDEPTNKVLLDAIKIIEARIEEVPEKTAKKVKNWT